MMLVSMGMQETPTMMPSTTGTLHCWQNGCYRIYLTVARVKGLTLRISFSTELRVLLTYSGSS